MNLNEAIKDAAVTNSRALASTEDRSGGYLTDCVHRRTEYRYTDAEIVRELVRQQ